jgi:NAD(P)-dependent dehydrogenase (short-subunit alcohol dehydrogenase family)
MMTAQALTGRRAIVTGGAGGLGRAFGAALAGAGARVAIVDFVGPIDVGDSEEWPVRGFQADLTRSDDVVAVFDRATAWLGGLDILVNNAGIAARSTPLDDIEGTTELFGRMLEANLLSAVLCARASTRQLLAHGGDIVNVVTDHVHTCWWPTPVDHAEAPQCPWVEQPRRPGWVGMDLYDASKWALWGITRTWAMTLRPYGVRVNALSMGATDSPMQRAHAGLGPDDDLPTDLAQMWLDPEDVGRILVDLLAEGSRGRSGDSIAVWPHHPVVLREPTPELNLPWGWDPTTDLRGRRPATT